MARPTKNGLDYFPFDVGFFGDNKIRILKSRYGADGIAVYVKILCDVYKEGYFLPIVKMDDYLYVLADEVGTTVDKAEQILTFLRNRAMVQVFEKSKDELTGYDVDAVLTSRGIQKRYAEALKSRKKGIDEIKRDFWILSEKEEEEISAFYKSTKNDSYSEKNPSYSEKNPSYSEKNSLNKSKVNIKEIYKEKRDIPETDEVSDSETNTELPFLLVNESNKNAKEERKQKVFEPPTFEEVFTYAKSRGREELGETFYDYFTAGDWIDSEGKPVKAWKQKFITWETKNPKRAKARIDNDTYKVL